MAKVYEKITVENGAFKWADWTGIDPSTGRPSKYGPQFVWVIGDPEEAQRLANVGWNIGMYQFENGDVEYKLPVALSWKVVPGIPMMRVGIVTPTGNLIELDETTMDRLNRISIDRIDFVVRPRNWIDDKTGENRVKAYCEELVVYQSRGGLFSKFDCAAPEEVPFE